MRCGDENAQQRVALPPRPLGLIPASVPPGVAALVGVPVRFSMAHRGACAHAQRYLGLFGRDGSQHRFALLAIRSVC
jgi:hypothetical protein